MNNNDDESPSFLGLGFHAFPSSTTAVTSIETGSINTQNIVQALMQQCMEYHQEQEALRHQNQQQQNVDDDSQQQQQQQQPLQHETTFVMASSSPSTATGITADPTAVTSSSYSASNTQNPQWNVEDHQKIAEARARAQAVIARFHQQQEQLLCNPTTAASVHAGVASEIPPALFAEQRYKGLRREEERKRQMLLKNFDYVLMKESERIGSLTAQIEQSAIYEELVKRQYQLNLEQRKQRLLQLRDNGGGKNTKPSQGNRTKESKRHEETPSVAVYLSGLPTDGSIDETYIRSLFGVYGSLRKVRFYRDKSTGELKGDGLVVYNLPSSSSEGNNNAAILLESVCIQMNGAELPCGSVLRVEPADTNYYHGGVGGGGNEPSTSSVSADPIANSNVSLESNAVEETTKAPDCNDSKDAHDDLDDFFNSLE